MGSRLNKRSRWLGCTSWLSSIARPTLKPSSPLRNVFHHRLHVEPLEERQLLTVMTPYEAEYLVITADSYADEIEPLADWKQLKGVPTYVATMSDVGTTDDDIYNYISNVYSSNSDLSYVLLVGDHEDVPGYEIDDGDIWYSDYPYTCVQGGDMLPEIAVGRLSGDMGSQITTQVNKIMDYERTPDMGDWYDDALVAGYFQDLEGDDEPMDGRAARMFMETTHRTADFLGGDYDFWGTAGSSYDRYDTGYTVHTALMAQDPFDTYYYQGWSYPGRDTPPSPVPEVWTDLWTSGSQATTNISAAINGGVSLVIHRDHGSPSGWGEPHFYTSNVNALSNGDKLPVVFSINCSSGSFDTTECFAEAFMRKYNGGAVGIMAAARVSYSGYNDALALAICDGFWDNADDSWTSSTYPTSWRPAEVINRAKVRVLTGYYYSSTAKRTARLFNWFGDPEMMLRTETPSALNVSYPYSTPTGVATDFTVTVTDGVSPVQGALVCISHPTADDYWVGTTNADGEVTFTGMTPTQNGTYNVVVTEHNSVPFEGTLESMVLGGIDLMGTGFDVVPDNLHLAFGTATVSFSVRNIGDTGTGEFDLKFYLSDDATIDPATDMLLELSPSDPHSDNTEPSAYHVSGGLASMSTISDTITLVVPGQDPFGTDNDYYLGMVVDADGDVNEVNETNNQDRGQGLDQDNAEYVVSTPVVNSFDDVVAAGDGKLTLREALEACNTNTVVGDAPAGSPSQVDIITFAEGLFDSGPQTIVLNGNQLAITDGAGVEIRGPGAELLTIDANRQSRVLYIATDAEASIDGVTFTNGLTPDYGGGIYNHGVLELIDVDILANEAGIGGGGIWSNDTVNLTGATIVGNSADNGGGIHNWGSASVTDSTIDDNAAIQGGGILNENYASLSVGNSSVSNNTAARGAAAYNDVGGELSIDGSALSDNSATDDGGAVYNAGSLLSLLDSTISRNSAGDNGGALFTIAGTTTVTASLIANNVATDFGGGVFSSGTVSITISTIAGNVADLGGGVYVNLGSTTAWNSIIAENYAPASPNLHGSLQSESDYNLVDVDPGFVRAPSAGADGIWGNTDDDKGDLHLRSTSVAINQGSSVVVPDAEAISVETDLDGKPRIIYDVVDIGVYEFALVADANYDATVDQGDSQVLASHWGMTGMTWNEGDFDLDGIVGPKDAALLGANWGATFTPPVSGSQPIADTGLAACPTLVGPLQANGPIAARRPLEPVIRKSLLSHKQPASVLESLPAAHDAALVEAFDPVAEQTVPQRLAWSFAMSRGSGDSEQDKLLDLHDAALDELLLNDVS